MPTFNVHGKKGFIMFSRNCGCLRLCRGDKWFRQCFPAIADACVYAEGIKGSDNVFPQLRMPAFMQRVLRVQKMFHRNCGFLRLCRGDKCCRKCFTEIADACVYAEKRKWFTLFYRKCGCRVFMRRGFENCLE